MIIIKNKKVKQILQKDINFEKNNDNNTLQKNSLNKINKEIDGNDKNEDEIKETNINNNYKSRNIISVKYKSNKFAFNEINNNKTKDKFYASKDEDNFDENEFLSPSRRYKRGGKFENQIVYTKKNNTYEFIKNDEDNNNEQEKTEFIKERKKFRYNEKCDNEEKEKKDNKNYETNKEKRRTYNPKKKR